MLVSVVIPAYNAAAFVAFAVDSVLKQTHRELELIVVDDGSTDDTSEVVRRYADRDERVQLVFQANAGVAAARNRGAAQARGELVSFLDADDEWLPTKLQRQVREFHREPPAVAAGCFMEYVTKHGKVLGVLGESTERRQQDIAAGDFNAFGAGSTLITWTQLFRDLGGFDLHAHQAGLPAGCEDTDLVSRLALHGLVVVVPEVLARYRVYADSMTSHHYFVQRQVSRYVAARAKARLHGCDLAWDEFVREHPPTLRQRWGDAVTYCYRTGGVRAADGQIASGIGYLTLAGLLGPRYVIRRLPRLARLVRQRYGDGPHR